MAEELEQGPSEADYPRDRGEQRQAGDQRQRQSELPRAALLSGRQSPGEDRDKDQIIDAEHDLEGGQRYKARPERRIG